MERCIYPRLVIAGTYSGVGKTTVTLAILAALKTRGRQVQAFKVGPDFIDLDHHSAAASELVGRHCVSNRQTSICEFWRLT